MARELTAGHSPAGWSMRMQVRSWGGVGAERAAPPDGVQPLSQRNVGSCDA